MLLKIQNLIVDISGQAIDERHVKTISPSDSVSKITIKANYIPRVYTARTIYRDI